MSCAVPGAPAASKRARGALAARLAVAGALIAANAVAAVPSAEKIANAVAEANRAAGRSTPVLIDITLSLAGAAGASATGVMASHPTGLARLELRSDGFVERHLLQGNVHSASRNGEIIGDPHPFLPPVFFLQATSGAALRAALASFGVRSVEIALGRAGEHDCYVFGGRYPRGEDGTEQFLPSLWVDVESFEVVQVVGPDRVEFRFGPAVDFGGIRVPHWIEIAAPEMPGARLQLDRVAPANAPAAAFGTHWLSAPANP